MKNIKIIKMILISWNKTLSLKKLLPQMKNLDYN